MTGPAAEAFRGDLLPFAAGVLLLAIGVAAVAAGLLRHASRAVVLSFGAACALYGVRLAARTWPARLLVAAPETAWLRFDSTVTYLIGIAAALFWAEFLGVRWRRVFRWVAAVNAVHAVVAVGLEAVTVPGAAMSSYVYLVLVNQALGLWAVTHPGAPVTLELRIVRAAYLVLVMFILNENASTLGLPSALGVEWIGFTVFLVGLGWAAALRAFAAERRLAAMNQEMETARRIQASILPRATSPMAGISLAARYQPMNAVAGDLYDVLVRDSGLGLFVADVCGHGVPAALVASMVKVAFTAQVAHADEPARVLAEVNRTLCGAVDSAFVTAAYAWLDMRSRRLRYAAAGHPPLLLRDADGVALLAENGMMMGVRSDAAYPCTSRALRPGDRLVLYTDGAIEVFNRRDEPFELDRLIELLATSRDGPEQFADAVLGRLAAWRGGRGATDDLTLIVLDVER